MASLDEAFVFPLTNKSVADIEKNQLNIPLRGSYASLPKDTNTYKPKAQTSDLQMYNFSLKDYKSKYLKNDG